jgi:hypothetical protein
MRIVLDAMGIVLATAIAVAFLYWVYEHVVRFFSISSWRRCPACDRVVLREAKSCERCGADLRAPAHRTG